MLNRVCVRECSCVYLYRWFTFIFLIIIVVVILLLFVKIKIFFCLDTMGNYIRKIIKALKLEFKREAKHKLKLIRHNISSNIISTPPCIIQVHKILFSYFFFVNLNTHSTIEINNLNEF